MARDLDRMNGTDLLGSEEALQGFIGRLEEGSVSPDELATVRREFVEAVSKAPYSYDRQAASEGVDVSSLPHGQLVLLWAQDVTLARAAQMPNLRSLTLMETTNVSDEGFINLVPASQLRDLDIDGERFTSTTLPYIARLVGLKSLSFSGTRLSDLNLELLAELEQLEYLSVARTRVSDAGITVLANSGKMKNLRTLDLTGSACTEQVVQSLISFPNLREVHAFGMQVDADALAALEAAGITLHAELPSFG